MTGAQSTVPLDTLATPGHGLAFSSTISWLGSVGSVASRSHAYWSGKKTNSYLIRIDTDFRFSCVHPYIYKYVCPHCPHCPAAKSLGNSANPWAALGSVSSGLLDVGAA